ncbi:glycosyltransferase [Yersinia enterocolitica]|uniref:glycosyltransferase n=1 Tax=Yersinia enterocolitica TaxID=630 RepID=UPI003F51D8FC
MGYIQVSFIIPVFNSEKYLPALFDSLQQQKDVFFEVIAINDGSTDSSLELLKHYELLIPNMIVINQRNMGLSCARNAGIKQAQGEWIMFMDSDDILMPNTIQTWFEYAKQNNLDVLIGNGFKFHSDINDMGGVTVWSLQPHGRVIAGKEWLQCTAFHKEFPYNVWLQLIRGDILKKHNLKFVPNILNEDILWTTQLAIVAERVGFYKKPLYGYRQNINSISNSLSKEIISSRIDSYIKVISELIYMAEANKDDDNLYKAILSLARRESGQLRSLLKNKLSDRLLQRKFSKKIFQTNIFPRLLSGAYGVSDMWRLVRLYFTALYFSSGR